MGDYQMMMNQPRQFTNYGSKDISQYIRDDHNDSRKSERKSVKIIRQRKCGNLSSNEDNTPVHQENVLKPK